MIKVSIIKRVKKNPYSKIFFQEIIAASLKVLKKPFLKGSLTILIVNPKEIRELNKEFRGLNKVTDVLTFPAEEKTRSFSFREKYLGEIVVCLPQARKHAKMYGYSLKEELRLIVSHGFLHLLGYTHKEKGKKDKMKLLEDKILQALKKTK